MSSERILILRTDRIGDTFITTPAIKALRHLFSDAQLDVLTRSFNRVALERNPYINRLYSYSSFLSLPFLIYQLRKNKYTAVIVMNALSRQASYIAMCIGSKEVWGFPDKRTRSIICIRNWKYERLYNHIPPYQIPFSLDSYCLDG